LEIVITGSMIMDDGPLGPGGIMTANENEFYGPHVAGPDGCVTVEIMDGRGARRLTFSTRDGDQTVDFEDPGFMQSLAKALPE
jgi:hypothetical protein